MSQDETDNQVKHMDTKRITPKDVEPDQSLGRKLQNADGSKKKK